MARSCASTTPVIRSIRAWSRQSRPTSPSLRRPARCRHSSSSPPNPAPRLPNPRGMLHVVASRGRSSAGRARRSQCRGREFDPPRLHRNQHLATEGVAATRDAFFVSSHAPWRRVMAESQASHRPSRNRPWALALAIAALAVVLLMPAPADLPRAGQVMLAVFAFALVLWITEAVDYAISAALVI